jgi:hypothetical protein
MVREILSMSGLSKDSFRFGNLRSGSVIVELDCNGPLSACRAAVGILDANTEPIAGAPPLMSTTERDAPISTTTADPASNATTTTDTPTPAVQSDVVMPVWLIVVLSVVGGVLLVGVAVLVAVIVWLKARYRAQAFAGGAKSSNDVPMPPVAEAQNAPDLAAYAATEAAPTPEAEVMVL